MARFREILRCIGVDEDAIPPGAVVPLGGSSFVALTEGAGLRVVENHRGIEIEEVVDPTVLRTTQFMLSNALPHITDRQASVSLTPKLLPPDARLFEIRGRHKLDFPGVLVQAISGRKTLATLKVVVVDRVTIKIAIRNLKVPDKSGNMVFHASKPCDPKLEQEIMNRVWIPQANIAFDLVSEEPATLDTRDRGFKETMAKELNVRDPITKELAPELIELAQEIPPKPLEKILRDHAHPKAKMTFFVVQRIMTSTGMAPHGIMFRSGISFIAGAHAPTTFAHEAGHFIGGEMVNGGWDNFGHTYDGDMTGPKDAQGRPKLDDVRYLMRDDGAGWKIPFKLVEKFRGFATRHP